MMCIEPHGDDFNEGEGVLLPSRVDRHKHLQFYFRKTDLLSIVCGHPCGSKQVA